MRSLKAFFFVVMYVFCFRLLFPGIAWLGNMLSGVWEWFELIPERFRDYREMLVLRYECDPDYVIPAYMPKGIRDMDPELRHICFEIVTERFLAQKAFEQRFREKKPLREDICKPLKYMYPTARGDIRIECALITYSRKGARVIIKSCGNTRVLKIINSALQAGEKTPSIQRSLFTQAIRVQK